MKTKNYCFFVIIISFYFLFSYENFLIVAPAVLQNNQNLQEFITWKKTKGFQIHINYTEPEMTMSEIDNWIETQFENLEPPPLFLLIVGDADGELSIPAQTDNFPSGPGQLCSDLTYGVIGIINNTNRIPDIYTGRISVRSESELEAVISKILWYERDQFICEDPDYLSSAMGVSNNKADLAEYQNAIISYGWDNYFNETSLNPYTNETNDINGIAYTYPHTDTLALIQNIKDNINSGIGLYYYIGNSDAFRFKYPDFTISDLDDLNNFQKYPIVIGGG